MHQLTAVTSTEYPKDSQGLVVQEEAEGTGLAHPVGDEMAFGRASSSLECLQGGCQD